MNTIDWGRNAVLMLCLIILSGVMSAKDRQYGKLAERLNDEGLVDIADMDSTIVVDLMYARGDNFVGENMYGDLCQAFLHPDAARALIKAQSLLREKNPGYRLKVCDAARPMSVQRKMYERVRRTPQAPYVSNPARGGGLHNYGLAVDVTIVDESGRELSMGTPVDHLGPESNIANERNLVRSGKITEQERNNRLLLREVMRSAGFKALPSEWWHFNYCSRDYARKHYKCLDF